MIDAALETAFARRYGVNLLDPKQCHPPNSNPLDENFIPDRGKLRSSRGGAAIRPLADRQLFLNSICNVVPQLIDHKDSTGNTTPGLFPSLSDILGVGSFDHDNAETRWQQFLISGSQAAAEFSREYEMGKATHAALVIQTNQKPDSEKQRSIFDQTVEGFGFGIKKIHKVIQDERQLLKHIILTERAQNLPIDDTRRMAFIANGTDAFARQFLGTIPVADTPFTPSEYTTAVALHMGVPIQAIKNRVGEAIHNNPNCQFSSVDHYGHNLTTVAGIEGGGTQRNHNTIARTISNSLSSAGIKHLGGATDRSCKTVFRNTVPPDAAISDDSGKQINSMIPDLVTFTKHFSCDETPLGGADHLVDVKTLGAGQAYHSNSITFGNVVETRQSKVNTDYHSSARRLDTRLHGTQSNERGPFVSTLFEYGIGGRVLGPVVGAFGEASSDLGRLRDLCAHALAAKHVEYYRMTHAQAKALYRHQLNRKWGHTIARGWARLILDRLRDYVGSQRGGDHNRSTEAHTNDAHEQFGFFNPAHAGQGRNQQD